MTTDVMRATNVDVFGALERIVKTDMNSDQGHITYVLFPNLAGQFCLNLIITLPRLRSQPATPLIFNFFKPVLVESHTRRWRNLFTSKNKLEQWRNERLCPQKRHSVHR